jgi:hypothetical protein
LETDKKLSVELQKGSRRTAETPLLSCTNFWTESLVLVEKTFWCLLQGKEKEKERETRDV